MLMHYWLLSVGLSITSCYCIEMADWIDLFFGTEATLSLSYTIVLEGNLSISKNNSISLWNFFSELMT